METISALKIKAVVNRKLDRRSHPDTAQTDKKMQTKAPGDTGGSKIYVGCLSGSVC